MVAVTGATTAKPSFVAPNAPPGTVLTFSLSTNTGGLSSAANVSVTIQRDKPWGVAPSASLAREPQSWAPAMSALGVGSVRGFDSGVAPDRLKPLTDTGMDVSGILWWSSPSAPDTLPVNDLNGWRNYVTAMVTRYKGRVRHWEVWNEPPNFTHDVSPLSYGAVVAAAYDAAKAVDPTVQIGLATKSNHVNWLAQAIEGGAANKFDFVTLHPYEVAGLLPQGWEGQFMSIVPRVRKMLQDKNPAKANMPVWFTEIGLPVAVGASEGVTPEVQADELTRIYTLSIAQGAARVHWFSPRDSEGMYLGLASANGSMRPSSVAMRTLSNYLGARPNYRGWLQPNGTYYGFVFAGTQGTVLSLWTRPGTSTTLNLQSPVTVVDPRTGAARSASTVNVTNVPILLVAPATSVTAQQWQRDAAANIGKFFPWLGDRSASTFVSLTAGSPSQGVFMVNQPAPSYINGVPEFNLMGRDGASFVVDPSFLSYTTTPIRITIVLRSLGTGDPGFNLKYESNAPYARVDGNGLVSSSAGWHRVASTNFYEKTWTLNDTRFVGLYGYNFRLDTDGPSHSQFSIQRVTVSK